MVWLAAGHPDTGVRRIHVQMSRLLPLNGIAKFIIHPSEGDRQEVCGDGANTRQRAVFWARNKGRIHFCAAERWPGAWPQDGARCAIPHCNCTFDV
jgi:hypothetical protein